MTYSHEWNAATNIATFCIDGNCTTLQLSHIDDFYLLTGMIDIIKEQTRNQERSKFRQDLTNILVKI